jgi:hypothetical protein
MTLLVEIGAYVYIEHVISYGKGDGKGRSIKCGSQIVDRDCGEGCEELPRMLLDGLSTLGRSSHNELRIRSEMS